MTGSFLTHYSREISTLRHETSRIVWLMLCSQQPAIAPYPEADESNPPKHYFPKIISNFILLPTSASSEESLPFRFSNQTSHQHHNEHNQG
jgi:hypothetical protein